jgi:hypothetical protein
MHDPKWYRRAQGQRPTTNELLNQLRFELWAPALSPKHSRDFSTPPTPNEKSEKCEFSLCSAAFLSIK